MILLVITDRVLFMLKFLRFNFWKKIVICGIPELNRSKRPLVIL